MRPCPSLLRPLTVKTSSGCRRFRGGMSRPWDRGSPRLHHPPRPCVYQARAPLLDAPSLRALTTRAQHALRPLRGDLFPAGRPRAPATMLCGALSSGTVPSRDSPPFLFSDLPDSQGGHPVLASETPCGDIQGQCFPPSCRVLAQTGRAPGGHCPCRTWLLASGDPSLRRTQSHCWGEPGLLPPRPPSLWGYGCLPSPAPVGP